MGEFYWLIMNTDCHTFCRKREDKMIFFLVPPSETAPNTISLALCHISTFTLTIPVSRLKAELITLPFCNSHHTNIITVTIFSPSTSTLYSSLFSKFIEIQKSCQSPILNLVCLSVLPCSSNKCSMLWRNNTGLDCKDILIFFSVKQ